MSDHQRIWKKYYDNDGNWEQVIFRVNFFWIGILCLASYIIWRII